MTTKLFIDTMVYLHFRPLDELNLKSLLNAEAFTLVIPRVTLRELDKHKSTHPSRKVRDRAKRVLDEIESAIRSSSLLKGGIRVEPYTVHPKQQIESLHLSETWADDVLIASMISYRESTGSEDISLITQDSGPRIACLQHGIQTYQLHDSFALGEDIDEAERENRELKKEIQRLKSAMPRLTVAFAGSNTNKASFTMKPHPPFSDESHASTMRIVEAAFPRLDVPSQPPDESLPNDPIERAKQEVLARGKFRHDPKRISPEEYRRYNNEREYYLREYDKYLQDLYQHEEMLSRTISFQMEIRNEGTQPAEDVRVFFHFPNGFTLLEEQSLSAGPAKPRPPQKPMSTLERLSEARRSLPGIMAAAEMGMKMPPFTLPSSFSIEETNSYDVRDHFASIPHELAMALPKMHAVFLGPPRSFQCDYTLHAANLPQSVKGKLNFVISFK